jgi:MFS superfamily sulfate permease-like transporter
VPGVVFTDLLKGIGLVFAIFYMLRNNYKNLFYLIENKQVEGKPLEYKIVLAEEVSFLNKASFLEMLHRVPANSRIVIDGSKSNVIDYDIIDIIDNFKDNAQTKNITLEVVAIEKEKLS